MSFAIPAIDTETTLKLDVERALEDFFSARKLTAASYGENFERLWALSSQGVRGGKLVRPVLMLKTYDALVASAGGLTGYGAQSPSREAILKIAGAIELLHYSFLLHDDVLDGDVVRRGRPNLIGALLTDAPDGFEDDHQTQVNSHWANTGAILMGDLLLSNVHQLFARVCVADTGNLRLLDLLEHVITESVAGEHLDVAFGDGVLTPDLADILEMCVFKTATYSFEFPLRAAVILAGFESDLEEGLSVAGRHLGLAFQLQDDLLSTFGDPSVHGKDPFSDLREGKHTAVIAYARQTSAWSSIEPVFGKSDLSMQEAETARSFLVECGARDFVQGLLDAEVKAFRACLENPRYAIPRQLQFVLHELAKDLDGRQL